ncbi:ABC transporter permease [Tahibacter sp. UC22_41]|uniref:ABC transporter permease n=1 Tax=Tahibacter sp. UC22_41 TaxID=3350178 RepID=UPI0036DE3FCF
MKAFVAELWATWRDVFADSYAVVTMIGAIVLYSVFYPAAYRHEVASNLPVVVVDEDHGALGRDLLRRVETLRVVRISGFAVSMDEARRGVERGDYEGILAIPAGFERDSRAGGGQLVILGNGAFLGRASSVLAGLGEAIGGWATDFAVDQAKIKGTPTRPPFRVVQRPLFNTREGYGSGVVPGVAELIVHQTLLIGIGVVLGGRRQRDAGRRLRMSASRVAGMLAAFAAIGLPGLLYFTGLTFWVQDYPRGGNLHGLLVAGPLFIAATGLFAMFLGSFFVTRERAFQYVTASSLLLFFLANLSWPATSTPLPLQWFAKLLPTTAGITAMVQFNQMGASLDEAAPQLLNLAALVVLYGLLVLWRFRRGAVGGGAAN